MKWSKYGKSFLVIFFSLIFKEVVAQQRHEFSVQQAIEFASKNNIQVKNALEEVKVQREINREVTSLAYPQFSGSISANHFPNVAIQTFPNFIAAATYGVLEEEGVKDGNGNPIVSPSDFGFIRAQFGTKFNTSYGVDFSWVLFDGQVFVGLLARDAVLDLAKKNVEVTEEQIKANIYKIYYQLVVGKKQLESVDANIALLEKLLRDTKLLYENGFAEKLDIDKTSVSLTNLKTERTKLENSLTIGNSGLKFLMGMPQQDVLILTDTLNDDEIKKDIAEATYTYTDRKEFQQIEIAEKLGEYNIKRYRLSRIPSLAAFGSYSRITQGNKLSFNKTFPSSVIGLKVTVPLFEGFAKEARYKKAFYELNQTKNSKEQLKQSIDMEVEQARIKIRNAIITMDAQKENQELAQKVYNTQKKKYEQGLGSNLDIINAQTELKTAQTNYFSAVYDAIIARIDYLKATGKL